MAKTIIIVVFILGISVLPIYPHGPLNQPDPVSISDSRVVTEITEKDLQEIIRIVRAPVWGGLWDTITRGMQGLPILQISRSREVSGQIEVQTGIVKAPLHAFGYMYHVRKEGEGWILVTKSRWIS